MEKALEKNENNSRLKLQGIDILVVGSERIHR